MIATAHDIREQAAQRFAQLGWPTSRQEEWKYTNVAPIARVNWKTGDPNAPVPNDFRFFERAVAEHVFVNGRGAQRAPVENDRYARYADYMRHPFTALNTANAQDGAHIEIPDGTIVDGFIHLLFVGDGDEVWSHPRNLIVIGKNAQVTIVETYVGRGKYFTNAVTELVAKEGAVVEHIKVECESLDAFHVGTLQIHEERAASVTSRCIALGGALVRNEINVALAGEGASIALDGLFTLTGNQHCDNHTVVDHLYPHCDSLELYKGILDQSARGIFDGRIIVRPDAQKTNSRQTNHNLLLSETAIVDSKPTLEIHNDDVKCNHGSTIGQLDEEALFYLRSRGIGEAEARGLLIYAFASEIVDRIKAEPVRELVRREMFRRMPERMPERRAQ
ncbi:MAG TPA: Fe-S cluster assembly protein SufD [Thermoanaerobaculia bacterium]|nr:Fe-S cluster assembly protein SufD [Thermoanaerobaculia bacterium]